MEVPLRVGALKLPAGDLQVLVGRAYPCELRFAWSRPLSFCERGEFALWSFIAAVTGCWTGSHSHVPAFAHVARPWARLTVVERMPSSIARLNPSWLL